MSRLTRIPCETCKEETLFANLKCTRCGAVFSSPLQRGYEAHQRRRRRHFAYGGKDTMKSLERLHTIARHAEYERNTQRAANGERRKDLPGFTNPASLHKRPGRTPHFRK
jgi:uncharacterized C2H2 Zn-finger protein